ncbi:MAG: 23S rRNA (uracil(1939)-C(5))-methyltransferase RlmD [Candidatus Latescibacterota bacterium]|jgi:23S rRNA (uracil1939-C5)-methyltransferase
MKRGDQIELDILEIDGKGDGRGVVGDREVVVRRAVPGDRVEARVVKKRRGRLDAEIEKIVSEGVPRQDPSCGHFGLCGGCRWQDLSYDDQLVLKERMVRNAFVTRGFNEVSIKPILPSASPFFYRNKMEFSFGCDREGNIQLGLHVRGRFNQVFNIEDCQLQSSISNRVVQVVRSLAIGLGLSVYDLRTHEGLLRFLVVREAKKSGQLMVNLVVASYPDEGVDALVKGIVEAVPEIDVLIVTLHQGKAQVAKGQSEFILRGVGHIEEVCGGFTFGISPQSFFQTNSLQADKLYNVVEELAGEFSSGQTLDLYCGTGAISLHLARSAVGVVGIEVVEEAVVDARRNAERNNVNNCEFIAGAAEDLLVGLQGEGRHFDLIVIDPPRPGVHKKALAALVGLRPSCIVYVSCNPETLADDLVVLTNEGYHIGEVQPVDMFPQTPHCEVVCQLSKT